MVVPLSVVYFYFQFPFTDTVIQYDNRAVELHCLVEYLSVFQQDFPHLFIHRLFFFQVE